MAKIFLYDNSKKKIITMDRDDPRIAWERTRGDGKDPSEVAVFRFANHGPLDTPDYGFLGKLKARDEWHYRCFGETLEQLCKRVNAPICRTIAILEQQIVDRRREIELAEGRKIKP